MVATVYPAYPLDAGVGAILIIEHEMDLVVIAGFRCSGPLGLGCDY